MRSRSYALPLALAALATASACNPPMEPSTGASPTTETSAAESTTPSTPTAQAEPTPSTPPAASAGSVAWRTWEEGLAEAQANDAAIMLYVYADWCPRCRELAPVFEQDPVVRAGESLVLVRYNQDEESAFMRSVVGDTSTYVPRVLFLDAEGHQLGLTSPHPNYPLFYTPSMRDALVTNMGRATESGG